MKIPEMQVEVNRLQALFQLAPIRVIRNRRLKRVRGKAKYGSRTIEMADYLNNSEERQTLLHEFAHFVAKDVYGDGKHGRYWKSVAIKLGIPATARSVTQKPHYRWLYACSEGCEIPAYNRRNAVERGRCLRHNLPFERFFYVD